MLNPSHVYCCYCYGRYEWKVTGWVLNVEPLNLYSSCYSNKDMVLQVNGLNVEPLTCILLLLLWQE